MSVVRDRKVLAVSADTAYLSVLKLCMRTCGFSKVLAATNVTGALKHLEASDFDLIISDWNMTPMDGLRLLRIVRRTPRTAATPFILMASSPDELRWREAIDLGATDFLVKPLSLASLRAACAHLSQPAEYTDERPVAPPSDEPDELVADRGRGVLRGCYEQIRRFLQPAFG